MMTWISHCKIIITKINVITYTYQSYINTTSKTTNLNVKNIKIYSSLNELEKYIGIFSCYFHTAYSTFFISLVAPDN